MQNNCSKKYALDCSPFYRLSSKKRLAKILGITPAKIKNLTQLDSLYVEREVSRNGKKRLIEQPKYQIKQVQSRIADLLSRIETPEFLFCPVRGRSYISNAKEHVKNSIVRSLDVKAYFQSTSSKRVYWFFHQHMKCASDIAGILTAISTFKKHLPTGSPLSPLMSYYAHVDMWNAINKIAYDNNCTLTVYMDDLTVSGVNVPDKLIWQIKQQIHRYGLQYHKEKHYIGEIRDVTGVIIRNGELKLPNRQHLKISKLRQQLKQENSPKKRTKFRQRLQGLKAQATQIALGNS